jgi:predicted enzyme related to lactoylglutathione lyase
VDRLETRGVKFLGPIVNDAGAGSFAHLEDPDGNSIYLWETNWGGAKQNATQYSHA